MKKLYRLTRVRRILDRLGQAEKARSRYVSLLNVCKLIVSLGDCTFGRLLDPSLNLWLPKIFRFAHPRY